MLVSFCLVRYMLLVLGCIRFIMDLSEVEWFELLCFSRFSILVVLMLKDMFCRMWFLL